MYFNIFSLFFYKYTDVAHLFMGIGELPPNLFLNCVISFWFFLYI